MAYYKYDTSKPEPVKKNSFQPYISLVVFLAVAAAVLVVCFNLGKMHWMKTALRLSC